MNHVKLSEVTRYCARLLKPETYQDYDRAWNGLQVENRGHVTRLAAAVDATRATVELAIAAGADLLIVHHGLFWHSQTPWTGRRYELICRLIEGNLAVYSQHLPLDGHPKIGNAAQLAASLGFKKTLPFFEHKGAYLGVLAQPSRSISRDDLRNRLRLALASNPTVLPGGSSRCRKIGICTGGAGAEIGKAATEGVDTFITGEGPHWTHGLAEDFNLNVFYGGHYATETFGVKALAAQVSKEFGIPWKFIHHPSGL